MGAGGSVDKAKSITEARIVWSGDMNVGVVWNGHQDAYVNPNHLQVDHSSLRHEHGGALYSQCHINDGRSPNRSPSPSPRPADKDGKEVLAEPADVAWHRAHCTDRDLATAKTVAEAYPYDARDMITIHKKEQYWGLDRRQDWGNIRVHHSVKQINCDVCGTFVVDRKGHELFYYCTNCRKNHRKLELCPTCYACGAVNLHKPEPATETQTKALQAPNKSRCYIPSGHWKGYLTEEKTRRSIEYELNFSNDMLISGKGPEGCVVSGSVADGTSGPRIVWTEAHIWGSLEVSVSFFPSFDGMAPPKMSGSFKASDGGCGTLELIAPPKPRKAGAPQGGS
eukprot:gnl/TRDRNA2_/TRDRNA2_182928_c0_seq1.p1 gnl/TRDRNA2_/TRDRNA2_182928_c0~~gnl/TRDRNA2_/TRDRNA2_182928_c0_seq1.p1  ORF type:complete len:338 (+),score=34.52 gnl/TRDRNA2_/TRDRNA2_182928_c0_seq1:60-1073(+)